MLTSVLVFATYFLHAQDQKWSVEANYPLNVTSDNSNFGDLNGVIDLGLAYKFLELGPLQIGAGLNASFFKNYDNFTYGGINGINIESDYKAKTFLFQPKLFAEVAIPGIPKLKPKLGIGYSILLDDVYYKNDQTITFDGNDTNGGLNLNLGLSYDLSDRFFLQVQYDYINIARKGETTINGQSYPYDFKEDAGILKAGVGFRF